MGATNKAPEDAAEERRNEAWQLRVRGYTERDIAKQIGVSKSTVHKYLTTVVESLRENSVELAEKHRNASIARLDDAIKRLAPLIEGDDDDKALAAMDRLERLERRRATLLGLDAPEKHDHTLAAGVDTSPGAAARLVREQFGDHGAKGADETG